MIESPRQGCWGLFFVVVDGSDVDDLGDLGDHILCEFGVDHLGFFWGRCARCANENVSFLLAQLDFYRVGGLRNGKVLRVGQG